MQETDIINKNVNTIAEPVGQAASDGLAQSSPSVHFQRIVSLDGLRAVAFLSVFAFHLGKIPGYNRGPVLLFNEAINWGFLGVDLFFVISGFIITALLLDEKARNNKIEIKLFFQRRALRIWPLFYLTLVVSIIGAVVFAKSNFDYNLFGQILRDVYLRLACFIYMVPLPVGQLMGKLITETGFPVIHCVFPLWSICVEEQFYIVWPWIIAITKNRRQLALAMLISVIISEYCRASGVVGWSGNFYFNPVSRIPALAVGALIAMGDHSRNRIYKWLAGHAGLACIVTGVAAGCILSKFTDKIAINFVAQFPGYLIVVVALGGLLLAGLKNVYVRRILSTKWLEELGKLTYCMYLVHFPIVYVTRPFEWTFVHDNILRHVLWAVISFTFTLLIARLSWTYLERPLARLRSKFIC